MPYAKKTLSDCLQSLADRHESNHTLPTSSATLTYWTRILNRGVNYCADKLRLTKSKDYTTSSGSVALDDDFLAVEAVFLGDTEYTLVNPNDETQHTGTAYWITGNQTDGFTLNVVSDDTYTVKYSYRPAEMVNTTDVCVIPDIEAPVAYAYGTIRKTESDPFEDAATSFQECDARLAEMQSVSNINDNAVGFTW